MSTESDRRAQGVQRIPFEALVEVGGAEGPSFEAQAVNVSADGMQLRTAYLPQPGQPLTCRFDTGPGKIVMAAGEVAWALPSGKGGEFGVRFTDLDAESAAALRKMTGGPDGPENGSKVRLHIDGLASPMRARVKDAHSAEVTVGSELGFLQVGKQLELENAQNGNRRLARIDRVQVELDPSSNIPQLVVGLRYDAHGASAEGAADDIPVDAEEPSPEAPVRASQEPVVARRSAPPPEPGDLESMGRASEQVKGAVTRGVDQVGSMFAGFGRRTKTALALLAARRGETGGTPGRRTTAPAPGGGLHSQGRRVVRGENVSVPAAEEVAGVPKFRLTGRKLAIGGAVGVALVLASFALRKPAAEPPLASAPPADTLAPLSTLAPATTSTATPGATTGSGAALAAATGAATFNAAPGQPPTEAAPPPGAMGGATGMGTAGASTANAFADEGPAGDDAKDEAKGHKKRVKVAPFGNGPVAHANVLHLKMDGAIEKLEGASQPTGFTVRIPGRRSLEAAGPLAARDARIAAIRVANDANGAELSVTFKDGVPNYQVRAKGESLEIALAPVGSGHEKAIAKKDAPHEKKHAKKKHDHKR